MSKTYVFVLTALLATGAVQKPAFEVATVKRNPTLGPVVDIPRNQDTSPGRFRMTDVPLRYMLEWAYDLKDYEVTGPTWIVANDRFDVVAKAETAATDDEMRPMLQTLLSERFQMKLHRETRELPVYVLVPGKGPALVKPAPADEKQAIGLEDGRTAFHNFPISRFTFMLTRRLDQPTLDLTGLKGMFDFSIDLSGLGFNGNPPADTTGPSVFNAVHNDLGLKLEARKHPIEVLVVDHAEKIPKEN